MYVGLDLGTSGLKAVLMNEEGDILSSKDYAYPVQQPKPLWSEQVPEDWWNACQLAFDDLYEAQLLKNVKGIGIGGQMHGAVLLGEEGDVLRPAILWNDGRSWKACEALEQQVKNSRDITGNLMMPGFTAPKLLWIQENEPEIFSKIHKVLLPKDYLRYKLSGSYFSEMSDAAGTMWLDTKNRAWHKGLLNACGLTLSHMPELVEGSDVAGQLLPGLAERWEINRVPLAGGAGDNACAAVGMGIVEAGQSMLSLGTSGVIFSVSPAFQQNCEEALHSFCHALPDKWHLMSVHLSAASCVQWFADAVAHTKVSDIFDETGLSKVDVSRAPVFLPYLSGERTPLNNAFAVGNFFGLTVNTRQIDMLYAILEGVAFAFKDGLAAMQNAGHPVRELDVLGGGARSPFWRDLLASVLDCNVLYRAGAEVAAGLGAARLAKLAVEENACLSEVCRSAELISTHQPNSERQALLMNRYSKFTALKTALLPFFKE
ncbi:xylulokinase [Agaribacter flavus]|uniref:Xylulose kinase n=1 Tax=Agaribacter flavus TaxID=1902781 RepID=A0ABV7FS04_9ALTE